MWKSIIGLASIAAYAQAERELSDRLGARSLQWEEEEIFCDECPPGWTHGAEPCECIEPQGQCMSTFTCYDGSMPTGEDCYCPDEPWMCDACPEGHIEGPGECECINIEGDCLLTFTCMDGSMPLGDGCYCPE
jgi:hypothetical protein